MSESDGAEGRGPVVPAGEASVQDRGRLAQLVFGQMAAQTVATAAAFGLADLIGETERSAAELAEATGCHPGSMTRLLRTLAALELLTESRAGHFRLTGAGALLRTDRPDSMHALVTIFSDAAMLDAWRSLSGAVRTGQVAFDKTFGTDFFTYLAGNPALSERFNTAMRQGTHVTAQVLPAAYDFGRFSTVADIGGGDGTLLAAVLGAHPRLRGILYDTPEGLAQAEGTLAEAGVAQRCTTRTGDFFAEVPAGADLYLLKSVIHDWDDERATLILRHCRAVIPEHGRVLIVEPVLPDVVDGSLPALMYLSDLNMLVNVGGRERTRDDFAALCTASGFELADITALPPAGFSLIEAVPAGQHDEQRSA